MRTIEHRRWLARATSTGVSAFVDSMGRVVQSIPLNARGIAMQDVPMLRGETLYERFGDWPGVLSLILLAFIFLRERLRPGRPSSL
jgi:apolipoprotein N-acyltransferase